MLMLFDSSMARRFAAAAAAGGLAVFLASSVLAQGTGAQAPAGSTPGAKPEAFGADWESWRAGNSVADLASLQRGARDFLNYCNGCHSLQYMRYSRIGQDLQIPPELLQKYLVPTSKKATDYIGTPMPGEVVREAAARSVADGARARDGLHLPVPHDVLCRSVALDRREQPTAAGDGDAGCALGARGLEARRVPDGDEGRDAGAGVRSLRDGCRGEPDARAVRRLRAGHREFPRLRRGAGAGASPRARRVGGAVPARLHVARVAAQEGILEGRALDERAPRAS